MLVELKTYAVIENSLQSPIEWSNLKVGKRYAVNGSLTLPVSPNHQGFIRSSLIATEIGYDILVM